MLALTSSYQLSAPIWYWFKFAPSVCPILGNIIEYLLGNIVLIFLDHEHYS